MEQIFQIAGAVLILTAFILGQRKMLASDSVPYLLMNVLGAGILAVVAAADRDWGFVLLEGVWTGVSAAGLAGRLRGQANERP